MLKIYLDTCIYLDYFEDRKDNLRPLGEFAFQLLKRTFECEFEIIISDWLLAELSKWADKQTITELFQKLKMLNKDISIETTNDDILKTKDICNENTHFQDALHFVLAKKAGAMYIVTRNINHFPKDKSLAVVFPENV